MHPASRACTHKNRAEGFALQCYLYTPYNIQLLLLRFGGKGDGSGDEEDKTEEPNFELSGKLTAETNTYRVRLR